MFGKFHIILSYVCNGNEKRESQLCVYDIFSRQTCMVLATFSSEDISIRCYLCGQLHWRLSQHAKLYYLENVIAFGTYLVVVVINNQSSSTILEGAWFVHFGFTTGLIYHHGAYRWRVVKDSCRLD